MTDSNLTSKELLQYTDILEKTSYTFTHAQFQQLELIAVRYESLNSLLIPIADDRPLSSVTCLLGSINEALFDFLGGIE